MIFEVPFNISIFQAYIRLEKLRSMDEKDIEENETLFDQIAYALF